MPANSLRRNAWRTRPVLLVTMLLLVLSQSQRAPAAAEVDKQAAALVDLQAVDQRVADIGWRLATRNLELCPAHFAATGLTLHTASQYDRAWRATAIKVFAFSGGHPSLLAVAQDSPAWRAGLRPNDILLSLGGVGLGTDNSPAESDKATYSETDRFMKLLEAAPDTAKFEVGIERGGQRMTISFAPVLSCASRFEMATSSKLNANSNGRVVQVFGRLVLALPSDDDLALVMGHELAHNALGHNDQIKSRKLTTGLFSAFTGSAKVLRQFELEADRYGIFMAARAGFDYERAPTFWRNFAAKGGVGAWIPVTHPVPSQRERSARIAVIEIDQLKHANKPLIPAAD